MSTNSIVQGEQVGILWKYLLSEGIKIYFAHQSFAWNNEAKNKAKVHCIIIGFGLGDRGAKKLFEYDDIKREPMMREVNNINPYLLDLEDIIIESRTKPLVKDIPIMRFGNMPRDDGNLIFKSPEELDEFLKKEPLAKKYIHKYVGSKEFINNIERWCLWLFNANPADLKKMPYLLKRVQEVREFREKSKAKSTRELANKPTLFAQLAQPKFKYLIVPRVSSEMRRYVPIGYLEPDVIISDAALSIEGASLYDFGILSSLMHNTWLKYIGGRLKSDYRYSKDIVYNNFPFPRLITKRGREKIANLAQDILNIRDSFKDSSLADLYSINTMPPDLLKAHAKLDREVDKLYKGGGEFKSDMKRLEFLLKLYKEYDQPLIFNKKMKKKAKNV